MTDTTSFFHNVVGAANTYVAANDAIRLLGDRIGADSSLSAAAAAAANASGRTDLTTADFDNFNAAVTALTNFLNSSQPGVNTATVKLAFYKLI